MQQKRYWPGVIVWSIYRRRWKVNLPWVALTAALLQLQSSQEWTSPLSVPITVLESFRLAQVCCRNRWIEMCVGWLVVGRQVCVDSIRCIKSLSQCLLNAVLLNVCLSCQSLTSALCNRREVCWILPSDFFCLIFNKNSGCGWERACCTYLFTVSNGSLLLLPVCFDTVKVKKVNKF